MQDFLSRNKFIYIEQKLFVVLLKDFSHENLPVLFLAKELRFQSLDKEDHGLVDWGHYAVPGAKRE